MTKRPGRKRKLTTERHKGRIIPTTRADRGTMELQQRRAYLAQEGDPAKTVYPLGILWTNGQISEDEHLAGCRYAYLNAVLYGRESVAAVRYGVTEAGGDPRDPESEEYREWAERLKVQLRAATAALDAVSRQHRDCLVNIAVYERTPAWMLPRIPSPADVRDARRFQEAIKSLAAAMGQGRRRAA